MREELVFNFFNVLSVLIRGETDGIAGRRILSRYRHYRTRKLEGDPDIIIELGPFEWSERKVYLFSQYRVAEDYIGINLRYKIARWKLEAAGLYGRPLHLRLSGNLPAQIVMVDISINEMILWRLTLKDLMPVHAAAVMKDGQGIVITGRRGVGKTTLVGRLLKRGFDMVSEDRVFLKNRMTHGFRLPINIKYDRADPKIARLPRNIRRRLHRNRLLSFLTGGYISLLEPVAAADLLPNRLVEKSPLSRLIYLQSNGDLRIEKADAGTVAQQIAISNQFDAGFLAQALNAYDFIYPLVRGDYWNRCLERTRLELSETPLYKVTVPVQPQERDWRRIIEAVEG